MLAPRSGLLPTIIIDYHQEAEWEDTAHRIRRHWPQCALPQDTWLEWPAVWMITWRKPFGMGCAVLMAIQLVALAWNSFMCFWCTSWTTQEVHSVYYTRTVFRWGTIPPELLAVLFKPSHTCAISSLLLPGSSCEPAESLPEMCCLTYVIPHLCPKAKGTWDLWVLAFSTASQHISAGVCWVGPPLLAVFCLCAPCLSWVVPSLCWLREDGAWETCLSKCQECPAISDNLNSLLGKEC